MAAVLVFNHNYEWFEDKKSHSSLKDPPEI